MKPTISSLHLRFNPRYVILILALAVVFPLGALSHGVSDSASP